MKAVCVLNGKGINGTICFEEISNDKIKVTGELSGLQPGSHGFHVHQFGDSTNGCISAGPHFNPYNKTHGGPKDDERHVGDLGNIEVKDSSTPTKVNFEDHLIKLGGNDCIVGRSLVVHAKSDDMGKGGDEESKKTGNAGERLACGIIGWAK